MQEPQAGADSHGLCQTRSLAEMFGLYINTVLPPHCAACLSMSGRYGIMSDESSCE